MIETVTTWALGILLVSAALAVVRLTRGPSLADRIVALETIVLIVVSGIGVWTARTGDGIFLDLLVVVAIIGFVGAVTVARFIERRGAR